MKKWKVKLPGDRFFVMESDDPRKELAEQGYTTYALEEVIPSPLKAIRLKCLDCSCGSSNEVKLCKADKCPLYPYRFGKNPNRQGIGNKSAVLPTRKPNSTIEFSENAISEG